MLQDTNYNTQSTCEEISNENSPINIDTAAVMAEKDCVQLIARLVREADMEAGARDKAAQRDAVVETECTFRVIGNWVDSFDIKYLLSILALNDKDFVENFPNAGTIPREDRKALARTIESHIDGCQHCALKRGFDIEEDDQIKRICRDNRAMLLEMLAEDNEGMEIEGGEIADAFGQCGA
jgi:hypothetical protein